MVLKHFAKYFALCICCVQLIANVLFAEPSDLEIGVIVPVSGPGSLVGESMAGVVKTAELKNVKIRFEDDQCDGKKAIAAYLKLRKQGLKVFYLACSNSVLAVAPLAKKNGDLVLTSYAGSTRIRDLGTELIRINPDALYIAKVFPEILGEELRPVILFHEEQEYASSLADELEVRLGDDVLERVAYRIDQGSPRAEALRVKQSEAKSIVFIPVAESHATEVLKEFAKLRVSLPILGEVNLCDYPFSPADFGFHGKCLSIRFEGEEYENFLKKYKKVTGREPAYPFFDALAYDLFLYLDTLPSSARAAVPDVKKSLVKGFQGKFAQYEFSDKGESANTRDYLKMVEY